MVDFGEGRDPREGVGGGEIIPQVGKEGLRPEGASKPPQLRGQVGVGKEGLRPEGASKPPQLRGRVGVGLLCNV